MLPISDDNTSRRIVPVVTYALITLNILFFFVELSGGDSFIEKWAFVPSRFLANPAGDILTHFTSMFMHAGWIHLAVNMVYLWIFGDNVESRFGHVSSQSSICSVALRQLSLSWLLAPDRTCRIWEHPERLPACSVLTFCCDSSLIRRRILKLLIVDSRRYIPCFNRRNCAPHPNSDYEGCHFYFVTQICRR